jgi:hypothetical protein
MVTQTQLKNFTKQQLQRFNDEQVLITDDTIHQDVLAEDDGPTGTLSSAVGVLWLRECPECGTAVPPGARS